MTTIELLNMALLWIGESKGITALTDASRQAWTGALVYDHNLRASLRRFPWRFATKYAGCLDDQPWPLYLAAGPLWDDDPTVLTLVQAWSATATYRKGDVVRVASVNYACIATTTNNTPPNATYWSTDTDDAPTSTAGGDWLYAYRWPDDCLFVRRIVPPGSAGTGRQFNADPTPFLIHRDQNGLLICTNVSEAVIEYTAIDCDNMWADDLFVDYVTWELAAKLAPSLSRNGLTAVQCMQAAELAYERAAVVSAREKQDEPHGEAEWHRGRG